MATNPKELFLDFVVFLHYFRDVFDVFVVCLPCTSPDVSHQSNSVGIRELCIAAFVSFFKCSLFFFFLQHLVFLPLYNSVYIY